MTALNEGRTYDEVGQELGVAPATVYQRAYELRRKGNPELKPLKTRGREANLQERARKAIEEFLDGGSVKKEKPKAAPAPKRELPEPAANDPELDQDEAEALDSIFN